MLLRIEDGTIVTVAIAWCRNTGLPDHDTAVLNIKEQRRMPGEGGPLARVW